MAAYKFTWTGLLIRFVAAFGLVAVTYNPEGKSFYHWARAVLPNVEHLKEIAPLFAFAGVALLISWVVFLRATMRSLGVIGVILAAAFFGTLLWLLVDKGILPQDNPKLMAWIYMALMAGVLAIGMSWSHLRRRMAGQVDVDETDE